MRKKLKDVCMFYSGTGFPIQYQGQTKGEYPFYKVGDIANNAIAGKIYLELCNNYISSDVAKMIKGCILPKDTVVFAKIGEALKLNRRAITSCDCLIDNNAMGIAPKLDSLRIQYFYFCMKNLKMQTLAESTTVPSVRKTVLEKYEIEVPSLVEQEEIEKKLTLTQKIIEKRRQELSYLDEIIKARFVEMFGDPRSNPFGFEKKRLKDTCKVITGNTPSRAIEEYYGDYIEWIKTDNIVSGILNPTQATESLSEKGMNVGRTVEKDSILMACIAGSIASIGRVCITDRTVAFNQQINAVVPEQYNILFLYVLFQMSKDYLVEDINMALKGILSKSKLEEKEFIIPPMDLQEQFSDFVKQVDKSKFDTMTFAPIYDIINLYLHTHFYQGRR